ncbi:MAG: hypothetical protein V4587_00245 [Acidobacteriota bacterium]
MNGALFLMFASGFVAGMAVHRAVVSARESRVRNERMLTWTITRAFERDELALRPGQRRGT